MSTALIWFVVPCPHANLEFSQAFPWTEFRLQFRLKPRNNSDKIVRNVWQLIGNCYCEMGYHQWRIRSGNVAVTRKLATSRITWQISSGLGGRGDLLGENLRWKSPLIGPESGLREDPERFFFIFENLILPCRKKRMFEKQAQKTTKKHNF